MTATVADLFDRAAEYDTDVEAVSAALTDRRSASEGDPGDAVESGDDAGTTDDLPPVDRDPSPDRVFERKVLRWRYRQLFWSSRLTTNVTSRSPAS